VERELRGIPDASTLQRIRAEHEQGEVTPYVILERVEAVVARLFGDNSSAQRDGGHVPPRIAATLVATAYACELANEHPNRPDLRLPSTHARATGPLSRATAGAARRPRADRPS
jgi:hypothetical protein